MTEQTNDPTCPRCGTKHTLSTLVGRPLMHYEDARGLCPDCGQVMTIKAVPTVQYITEAATPMRWGLYAVHGEHRWEEKNNGHYFHIVGEVLVRRFEWEAPTGDLGDDTITEPLFRLAGLQGIPTEALNVYWDHPRTIAIELANPDQNSSDVPLYSIRKEDP